MVHVQSFPFLGPAEKVPCFSHWRESPSQKSILHEMGHLIDIYRIIVSLPPLTSALSLAYNLQWPSLAKVHHMQVEEHVAWLTTAFP